MMYKQILALLGAILILSACKQQPEPEPPITREQGDAILAELKEIKTALQALKVTQAPAKPTLPPDKIKLELTSPHSLGNEKAELVMVEFSDYQCPFCKRFTEQTFPELKKKYIDTGKLRYVVQDLPLDFHPNAPGAAHAAHCAGEQGQFWTMRSKLFSDLSKLDLRTFNEYAAGLSLNVKDFEACMASGRYQQFVQDSAKLAVSAGISGTPSFLIAKNTGKSIEGSKLVGAQPMTAIAPILDEMLKPARAEAN